MWSRFGSPSGSVTGLCRTEHSLTQQVETRTTVHLTLHAFHTRNLSLDRAGAPWLGQCMSDRHFVTPKRGGKRFEFVDTAFRTLIKPVRQLLCLPHSYHLLKLLGQPVDAHHLWILLHACQDHLLVSGEIRWRMQEYPH